MCLDKENLDMRRENNPFEMLVLSKPVASSILVDVKDEKGNIIHKNGKKVQKEEVVYAFIIGTPIMVDFINKVHESGIEIATLIDGTYRLNSLGWVVSILSTHSCLFASEKGYYQQCLPLIYLVTFTEVELAYVYHLESIYKLPITHFGSTSALKISHVGHDGALSILNATNLVIPSALKNICGVHVTRKALKVQKKHNQNPVSDCIRTMRNSKSLAMFKIITAVLLSHIIHNLKERKFADGFKKFYLHEKRSNWYYSISKKGGVSSDSSTLENYNNTGEIAYEFYSDFKSYVLLFQRCQNYAN